MKRTAPSLACASTLVVLATSLSGCAWRPPSPAAPAQMPPLPETLKQPPLPEWCKPTCSSALQIELQNWRRQLMQVTPSASAASAPTKP